MAAVYKPPNGNAPHASPAVWIPNVQKVAKKEQELKSKAIKGQALPLLLPKNSKGTELLAKNSQFNNVKFLNVAEWTPGTNDPTVTPGTNVHSEIDETIVVSSVQRAGVNTSVVVQTL